MSWSPVDKLSILVSIAFSHVAFREKLTLRLFVWLGAYGDQHLGHDDICLTTFAARILPNNFA
ncbi:hypothetical protein [Bifidobacterium tsurumiense]|uniref:Uncharacterized protein n=1 Tax=Bifidobacterium tsurumiense TaxID=356829 RepID=A0A087EK20_9BIFI|nr:hypothetical protein [Bifidobacterium tsurumiense]KFJ08121.1 hypothetical protein BITS_0445 [Bifidobacterium tsurumiense]MDY4678684.1 hypothetical protein [Bifidobacterium tsurumiense]MSS13063.1 hypothetical protein [Bifidobacterium tsurumiense]